MRDALDDPAELEGAPALSMTGPRRLFPLPLDFFLAESLDALALVAAAPLPPPLGEGGGFGGIVVARQL